MHLDSLVNVNFLAYLQSIMFQTFSASSCNCACVASFSNSTMPSAKARSLILQSGSLILLHVTMLPVPHVPMWVRYPRSLEADLMIMFKEVILGSYHVSHNYMVFKKNRNPYDDELDD